LGIPCTYPLARHAALPILCAGTGRCDRGVEGQEVGVVCDLLDDADDFADAQRMLSELLSPLCGLGDRVPDLLHGCDGSSYSLSTGTGHGHGSLSRCRHFLRRIGYTVYLVGRPLDHRIDYIPL